MTGWIAVVVLALMCFAFAAIALKLPRSGWTLFGAVLVFGLAGYAWQGSAEQSSSPKAAMPQAVKSGEALVEMRREMFDPATPKPDFLTVSDGFARRGQFADAAGLLRSGLARNPDYAEGWLALGMALIEHADGAVTPAARHAFDRSYAADPRNPAAPFILGASYLRMRDVREARAVWSELLDDTPEDAPWYRELSMRVEALDAMMAARGGSNAE